jgi:hypothetical protein
MPNETTTEVVQRLQAKAKASTLHHMATKELHASLSMPITIRPPSPSKHFTQRFQSRVRFANQSESMLF